ncbi:MAG: serine--tRNA ligase [Dehalococcoidia bacterium]|nr:serine--tRNA ligase [Dehalococcoidia bacterium]
MLSIQLIRQSPDVVRAAMARRGESPEALDRILTLDQEWRRVTHDVEELKAEQNRFSKDLKGKPSPETLDRMRGISDRVKTLEDQSREIEAKQETLMLNLPNLPHESVPYGTSSEDNKTVRQVGELPGFTYNLMPHWELGEKLGIIDFERGQRISGSRFYILKGQAARLQRALITFFLDEHTKKHGYTEIYPPFMVKGKVLQASGQLPKFAENLYRDTEDADDKWFVPTAEVPLTSMHADEILEASQLPINYVAYTPCFRKEKMSAGKDIRGLKRGHQFDKVEMYKFVEPSTSYAELESMLKDATSLLETLGIPYRILSLCSGDLGFAAAKTYDIEVWAAGLGEWLEVSSVSNVGDFQSRRANIRYRPKPGARPEYPHTLNGSGLALPRVMIAILENFQQADGSVLIPEALRPYTGFDRIGPASK